MESWHAYSSSARSPRPIEFSLSNTNTPLPPSSPFIPKSTDTLYRRRMSISNFFGNVAKSPTGGGGDGKFGTPRGYYAIRMPGEERVAWKGRDEKELPVKKRFVRRGVGKCGWIRRLLLVALVSWGGWYLAKVTSYGGFIEDEICDPYAQKGFLFVNTSYPPENAWRPISAPASCHPTDFTTLIYQTSWDDADPRIEFVRDKTIVLFGDSIDRDHNIDFCIQSNGWHEMVGEGHPLSPKYPRGEEIPPEDYVNSWTNTRAWPDSDQSRPFICHIDRLNFRIVNVFHYGHQPETDWMSRHGHYYPPASFEDRFDKILIPLLRNVASFYNTSAVPDLIEVSPGFWGLLRITVEINEAKEALVANGVDEEEARKKFDVWSNLKGSDLKRMEERTFEMMRYVAKGWESAEREVAQAGQLRRPQIVYRALHHVQEHNGLPFSSLQTIDQMGLSVVERLVEESRSVDREFTTLSARVKRWLNGESPALGMREEEALRGQLGRRLKVDHWGRLMLGQERHFRDQIHPNPLPGSFLWGNMILEHLRVSVLQRTVKSRSSYRESITGDADWPRF